MAVVLPALRLCLLLLNLYGTFKVIKPPPMPQRSTRNGQGPSGRAIQLRKREMKSRLAVWVVWAVYSILERPFDRTIGFITPFYNELKCTILCFLIVSRSHGAEAIFLHLIHPIVRPYVPAVDNILATLHSVFDLVSLLLFLPVEYVLHGWHRWSWCRFWNPDIDSPNSGRRSPDNSDRGDKKEDGRQLRPRNQLRQVRMREAERQAQVIFQDIDDAQDRVRTRTRRQLSARNNVRTQPVRETQNPDPQAVGLRTRTDHEIRLPEQVNQLPGSKSTGVHHLDPTTIAHLARGAPSQQRSFPKAPTAQPATIPSLPIRTPTPSSSSQSSHEIWYPPQSAFEARKRKSSSPNTSYRTPSPIYPPLPSAYPFTPRRSDPPPPPRIIAAPDLVNPTPRRVSTGGMSRGAVDAYEGIDQFPGHTSQAGPSASTRLAEPAIHSQSSYQHSRVELEDFFGQALEPSIQAMDVDMETLLTRDGSSASEESTEDEDRIRPGSRDTTDPSARGTEVPHGSNRDPVSGTTRSISKAVSTGPLRRSARTRSDRSPSVEADEFGFTIRQDSTALKVPTVDSSFVSPSLGSVSLAEGQSRKKPLARTKPALKPTKEEGSQSDSSDEESVKKKRKLRSGVGGQPRASAGSKLEVSSLGGDTRPNASDARKRITIQQKMPRSDYPEGGPKDRQVGIRATRASTRKPLSAQSRANVIKRDGGK